MVKMPRRGQLSIEFLVFVAIAALYLAGALALWKEGVTSLEKAATVRSQREIAESILFHSSMLRGGRGSAEEEFSLFPTARLNIFSDGEKVSIQGCGKISGETPLVEVNASASPFGGPETDCDRFPLAGKIRVFQQMRRGERFRLEVSAVD